MKIHYIPSSKLGKSALLFITAAILLIGGVMIMASNFDTSRVVGFFDSMPLALMVITGFVCAALASILGILSVIREKDKSVMVLVAILVGSFMTYFGIAALIGEITGTH